MGDEKANCQAIFARECTVAHLYVGIRFCREPIVQKWNDLANLRKPPQAIAENFPRSAHNGSNRQNEAFPTTDHWPSVRYVPGLYHSQKAYPLPPYTPRGYKLSLKPCRLDVYKRQELACESWR